MVDFIEINNLILALGFFSIPLFIFVPIHKWLSKVLEFTIPGWVFPLFIPLFTLLFVVFNLGIIGGAFLVLAIFNTWAFLFAFNVDRKYIYILALLFLGVTPVLLLLNLDQLAEYAAVLCYLALVVGVFKDIFYEKIFGN